MDRSTAFNTISTLIEARNNKDFDAAFACYELNATIVLQPGQTGSGEATIKAFIEQTSTLSLLFSDHKIVQSGDLALHTSQYTLAMENSDLITGRTADVLRWPPDGMWYIVIDNAWAGMDT